MQQELWVLLGKRLINNDISGEGLARVRFLAAQLAQAPEGCLLAICGGIMPGSQVREADCFWRHCQGLLLEQGLHWPRERLILENRSTSTKENLQYLAGLLLRHPRLAQQAQLRLRLVSSEHHLQRILGIQQRFPRRGLLLQLQNSLGRAGINAQIGGSIENHLPAPYPYQGTRAQAYLELQQLTHWRVYLDLLLLDPRAMDRQQGTEVRAMTAQSLNRLEHLTQQGPSDPGELRAAIHSLQALLQQSSSLSGPEQLQQLRQQVEAIFQQLSRELDPDQDLTSQDR